MLLVIDVGNTNITLGVFRGGSLAAQWRLTTGRSKTIDELGMNLTRLLEVESLQVGDLTDVIVSSVVPNLNYALTRAVQHYLKREPMMVSQALNTGLKLILPGTRELGADRLVTAAAAYKIYGGPVIVIDYGTASKYDVISAEGEFVTGVTAPGIRISAEALFERAALLGEIELALPKSIVAKNTVESLQCGILYGCIGQTEYIVSRLKRELNIPKAVVVATGGLSRVIASGMEGIIDHIVPSLTLEGMRIIYEMNRGG